MRTWAFLSVSLLALSAAVPASAGLGKICYNNYDCPDGAWCVAGDSDTAVQRCVAGTPCGGTVQGNCPGDESTGQLACIWRPTSCSSGECVDINGTKGIYKCISISRCDQYYGGSCSQQCNVNGQQCNGRGNCQLVSDSASATTPKFECACENGWNGTLCDNVANDTCITDVGQCGTHGTCKNSKCTCSDGYTGSQCEIAPVSSHSGSGATVGPSSNASVPNGANATTSGSQANVNINTTKKSKSSLLPVIIGVLAGVILIATAVFVFYARKKRQQDEAARGFQRSDSIDGADGDEPIGPPTPKQRIVTL